MARLDGAGKHGRAALAEADRHEAFAPRSGR